MIGLSAVTKGVTSLFMFGLISLATYGEFPMLRRDFAVAAAVAVMAAPAVVQAAELEEIESIEEAERIAQMFADMEYNGVRHSNPDDWKSLSYVKRVEYDHEYSLLYCVTHDGKFLERFAYRVEAAMDNEPNRLPVFALAKAGGAVIPDKEGDDGYHPVLMFFVGTEGLEKNMGYFAEMIATSKGPNKL